MNEVYHFLFFTLLWSAAIYFVIESLSGNKKTKEENSKYISHKGVFLKEWRFAFFCCGIFLLLIAVALYKSNTFWFNEVTSNIISASIGLVIALYKLINNKKSTGRYFGVSSKDPFFVFSKSTFGKWIFSMIFLGIIISLFLGSILLIVGYLK